MRNSNHLSLINFKVKTSSSDTFLNEHDVVRVYNTQHGVLTPHLTSCLQRSKKI